MGYQSLPCLPLDERAPSRPVFDCSNDLPPCTSLRRPASNMQHLIIRHACTKTIMTSIGVSSCILYLRIVCAIWCILYRICYYSTPKACKEELDSTEHPFDSLSDVDDLLQTMKHTSLTHKSHIQDAPYNCRMMPNGSKSHYFQPWPFHTCWHDIIFWYATNIPTL